MPTGRVQSRHYPQAKITHSTATVGTGSGEAVPADDYRSYLLLINDSANTIYLKFAEAAATNEGIRLDANGGSYEISAPNGNLDTRAINAIATGSSSTLLINKAR